MTIFPHCCEKRLLLGGPVIPLTAVIVTGAENRTLCIEKLFRALFFTTGTRAAVGQFFLFFRGQHLLELGGCFTGLRT